MLNTMIPLTETRRAAIDPFFFAPTKDKMRLAEKRTVLIEAIMKEVLGAYDELEKRFEDRKQLRTVERGAMLQAMDILWIDHLAAMGALRIGIGLSGYAQRDPLVEYKKESYDMFQRLLSSISQEISFTFFKLAIHAVEMRAAEQAALGGSLFERAGAQIQELSKDSSGQPSPPATSYKLPASDYSHVGRNDLCPCGSGKKFKKCHGAYIINL